MADKVLEFFRNILKLGREQFLLKSTFLRDKVPIKPVLGLTGLGVLFLAMRPLWTGKDTDDKRTDVSVPVAEIPNTDNEYTLQKTLYLMREKEKMLKKQKGVLQEKS